MDDGGWYDDDNNNNDDDDVEIQARTIGTYGRLGEWYDIIIMMMVMTTVMAIRNLDQPHHLPQLRLWQPEVDRCSHISHLQWCCCCCCCYCCCEKKYICMYSIHTCIPVEWFDWLLFVVGWSLSLWRHPLALFVGRDDVDRSQSPAPSDVILIDRDLVLFMSHLGYDNVSKWFCGVPVPDNRHAFVRTIYPSSFCFCDRRSGVRHTTYPFPAHDVVQQPTNQKLPTISNGILIYKHLFASCTS